MGICSIEVDVFFVIYCKLTETTQFFYGLSLFTTSGLIVTQAKRVLFFEATDFNDMEACVLTKAKQTRHLFAIYQKLTGAQYF